MMHHGQTAEPKTQTLRHTAGRLVRDVRVRLLDVSLSGCAVATDQPLDNGTVVRLQTCLEGQMYQDTVCTVRTIPRPGASPTFTVAGRFDWGNRLGTASVRGAILLPISRIACNSGSP